VGFTDYVSSGGAMKTRRIVGEKELRDFLTGVGLNERIVQPTLENLHSEGATSVLRVVLPDEMLNSLGLKQPMRGGQAKLEAAVNILRKQGHSVEPIIRDDGTMWFQVDRQVLVAWKEMQDLGDGVYSFDALVQMYKAMLPVRFTVFSDAGGVILAYSIAAPYTSTSFTNKAGALFPSTAALVNVLNKAGLPGDDIALMRSPNKVYTVSGAQLLGLNLTVPLAQSHRAGEHR
jgi:hypothetical protein